MLKPALIAAFLAMSFAAASAARAQCPAVLDYTFNSLQIGRPEMPCQYRGKVLLIVNTASYCGYTHQYEGLEALYRKYRDRGLVVLSFPTNDFGMEEPGTNKGNRRILQAHLRRAIPDVREIGHQDESSICRVGFAYRSGASVELPQVPDRPRRQPRDQLRNPGRARKPRVGGRAGETLVRKAGVARELNRRAVTFTAHFAVMHPSCGG